MNYQIICSVNYYCLDPVNQGEPVFDCGEDKYDNPICSSYKNKKGAFLGISLNNVANIDNISFFDCKTLACGSKISILSQGLLVFKANPKWKIPFGQKIYYDVNKNSITWRRTDLPIGTAMSNQDKSGFIKVGIQIK